MRNLLIVGVFALLFTSPVAAQDVYRVSDQVTQPRLLPFSMTMRDALALRQLSGLVRMEIDVMPDGNVGTVALVKSSGAELDAIAVDVAKRIKFTPGTKGGNPVAVRLALDLGFDPSSRVPMRYSLAPQSDSN